jgi:hypothetical protein
LPASAGFKYSAFTLLELLVVMAFIALLLGVLLPALASSRRKEPRSGMANLRSWVTLASYTNDDERGYTSPVNLVAEKRYYDGDYEYGGATGLGPYAGVGYTSQNRPLNRFIFRTGSTPAMDFYRCPSESGIPRAPFNFDEYFQLNDRAINKKAYEVTGTSYRINNHIDYTSRYGISRSHTALTWPPVPGARSSTTVILEETITEVAKWNDPDFQTMGWHRRMNGFNVSFRWTRLSIHLAGQSDQTVDSGTPH